MFHPTRTCARHVINAFLFNNPQASCPVCREPISRDVDRLRDANQPVELLNAPDFQLTSDLKTLQARMSNLYLHQKQQGGIIDLAAEETNVISIQTEADLERVSRAPIGWHFAATPNEHI